MRISIEPFHVYGMAKWEDSYRNEYFRNRLRILKKLHAPLIKENDCTFSILLDEKHSDEDAKERFKERILVSWTESLAEMGMNSLKTYVVVEEDLVPRALTLLGRLVQPLDNRNSTMTDRHRKAPMELDPRRFIKNYVGYEELAEDATSPEDATSQERLSVDASPLLNLAEMTRNPGIGIACELYDHGQLDDISDARYPSCALLAASWQLDRLGYFGEPTGIDSEFGGTFALLDPTFLPVETAVRLILRHTPDGSGHDGNRKMGSYLDRIAYQFSSEALIRELSVGI